MRLAEHARRHSEAWGRSNLWDRSHGAAKATLVPADHGLGPDNSDGAQNRRKKSVCPDQQKTSRIAELQSLRPLADKHIELSAQDQLSASSLREI